MAEELQKGKQTWIRKSLDALRQMPEQVRFAVEHWRERRELEAEFSHLRERGELERTLIDTGISASEVPRLMAAHPGARRQLAQMMDRIGIERGSLPGTPELAGALRDIEWRCGDCAVWQRCRGWLASGTGGDYRQFCPNAEALEALRHEQRQRTAKERCGLLAEFDARKGQYF